MAGKTIITDASTKPIFIKSLPIESSTQDESVPVEIEQDIDESVSDEGSDIATNMSIDEGGIEIEPEESPHSEIISIQILQVDKEESIIDEADDIDATSLSFDGDTIDFSLNFNSSNNSIDRTAEPTNSSQFSPNTTCPSLKIDSPLNTTQYFTPELNLTLNETGATSNLPKLDPGHIILDYTNWLSSMDGGGKAEDACKQAKLVITNMLTQISLDEIKNASIVCNYFTDKQKSRKLSAGSANVYLRHFSNFLLYLHQQYPKLIDSEEYGQPDKRISRLVVILIILDVIKLDQKMHLQC